MTSFPAGGGTGVTTQNLTAVINPAWSLTTPASATMVRGQQPFQPFQAVVSVNYRVRTTPTGGGTISVQVTRDFSPLDGPSVADGGLTYTCAAATLGNACSGSQTASLTVQTPVATLPAAACTGGGGACSNQDPNTVGVTFLLTDDPQYSTGSYSATITFTISAM